LEIGMEGSLESLACVVDKSSAQVKPQLYIHPRKFIEI